MEEDNSNNDQDRSPPPDGSQAPNTPQRFYTVEDVLESPEFAAILRQADTGIPGNEADPIVRNYGHLGEGYSVRPDSPPELRELMQLRYIRRWILSSYSELPEGYEVQHGLPNGKTHPLVLLTPPSHVAYQSKSGVWSRVPRGGGEHGPPPYSEQWYQNYLRKNDLPSWFFCPQHLSDQDSKAEADWLWLNDDENRPNFDAMKISASANYLNARYPRQPQFPMPYEVIAGRWYAYDLSDDDITRLARKFPAILANAYMGKYRVFLNPDYYLFIRDSEDGTEPPIGAKEGYVEFDDLDWVRHDRAPRYASYTTTYQGSNRSTRVTGDTHAARERKDRYEGGIVGVTPNGLGEWRWLDPDIDQGRAEELGYHNPTEVAVAQHNGLLTQGFRPRDAPMVKWWPDDQYLNPAQQPEGPGRWRYFTEGEGSSQDLAWTNFGDQPGFEGNPRPSARDMWIRRQQYAATGETDLTADLNLVWVPGETDPEEEEGDDQTGDGDNESTARIDPAVQDAVSGLYHDPTNGGENDQTGRAGEAWYQTQIVGGKKFTLDRSRAHANDIQAHKSWFVTKDGQWKQWKEFGTLDWTSKVKVEGMNKWREQCISRTGFWPQKRQRGRVDYTQEEKEWLFEHVKEAKGDKAVTGMKELARLFNQRFKGGRAQSGVQAVYDRLKAEYKRNDGTMSPPVQRGTWERPKKDSSKKKGQAKKSGAEDPTEEEEEDLGGVDHGDEDANDEDYVE